MLRLKEIELAGFKSFADRTRVPIPEDLLVVVGPNGSGKSNVTDAILWALGEQSPKSLRGHKMQDVIFNGSHKRPPSGMAEVLMTFTDGDGGRLQVGRRLVRTGESAYLMDGRSVRLKDVHEFLQRHAVSTQGSFLVEQGRVEALLVASPEERRMIFEEVAGIAHYKENRRSALQKLDATQANLLRLNDILLEVEGQMASLKRQAAKADRFVRLSDERRARQRRLWGRLYGQLSGRRAALQRDGNLLQSERERREAAASALEAELEAARLSLHEHEVSLQAIVGALHERDLSRERAEQEIARRTDQILAARNRQRQISADREDLARRVSAGAKELERLSAEVDRLAAEEASALAAVAKAQEALEECRRAVETLERERETLRQKTFAQAQEHSRLSAVSSRLEEDLRKAAERERRLQREEESLREREAAAEASWTDLAARKEEAEAALSRCREEAEVRSKEAVGLESQVRLAQEALAAARKDLAVAESEVRVLEEHAAALRSSAHSLVSARLPGAGERGLARLLAPAPEGLLPALAAVLGDLLAGYVDAPWESLPDLIGALGTERAGQAVFFLPGAGGPHPPKAPKGTLGYLHEQEGLPEEVRRLIPRALLTRTAEAARQTASATGFPAVSLDGVLVHPDGWVRGGSGGTGASSLLEHEHRLRQAARAAKEASRAVVRAEEQEAAAVRAAEEGRIALEAARLAEKRAAEAQALLERDAMNLDGERRRLAASRDLLEGEVLQAREERESFEAQRKDLAARIEASDRARREADAALQASEERHARARAALEAAHEAVAESRARHSEVSQRHRSAQNARKHAEEAKAQLSATDGRLASEFSDLSERVSALEKAVTSGQQELRTLILALEGDRDRKRRSEEDHARLSEELSRIEERVREARESAAEVREEHARVEVEHATVAADLKNLQSRLEESFEESPEDLAREFAGEPPLSPEERDEETKALARLEGRIQELGELNLAARSEYAELEQRHGFLSAQRKDLEDAVASLNETIRKINRTTRDRFMEAFNAVQEHFGHLFRQVFEGGEARLSLLDETNPLDTGVEIYAQPPGKKLQSLQLLSGGEKAMVALALLFGLFLYRPQPFFVLDEVDAPLDEANITRFSRLLTQFRGRTQFLVVSHNKRTMELADVLYGVTMAEGGVSRLVSVRLGDVEPYLGPQNGGGQGGVRP
ncbi:MAG: chromosome segregation protein SMC [Acidobacteriota bacterium]